MRESLEKQCLGRKITSSLSTTKLMGMEFHETFLHRLGELRTKGHFLVSKFAICLNSNLAVIIL